MDLFWNENTVTSNHGENEKEKGNKLKRVRTILVGLASPFWTTQPTNGREYFTINYKHNQNVRINKLI